MGSVTFNLPRGTQIDGYVIRKRLGGGQEGEVYRVREQYSQAERVMKLFDPSEYGAKRVSRYSKLLEAVSSVPGVIRYDKGGHNEAKGCHYILMQYVEGKTLGEITDRHRMHSFRTLRVVHELLCTVAGVHRKGYRVGDIHIGNVILAPEDKPVIIDLDPGHLNKPARLEDLTSTCKLLYSLTDNGWIPPDLKKVLPKRADVLGRRYNNAESVLEALDDLTGISHHST